MYEDKKILAHTCDSGTDRSELQTDVEQRNKTAVMQDAHCHWYSVMPMLVVTQFCATKHPGTADSVFLIVFYSASRD